MNREENWESASGGRESGRAGGTNEYARLISVARQHLKAAHFLGGFDGVTLPQLHSAALSIELHLQAYATHAGATIADGSATVSANLSHLLAQLPPPLSHALSSAFIEHHGGSLERQLEKFNHAFTQIRHHLQVPDFYHGFDLVEFMQLARFFGRFEPEFELPAP